MAKSIKNIGKKLAKEQKTGLKRALVSWISECGTIRQGKKEGQNIRFLALGEYQIDQKRALIGRVFASTGIMIHYLFQSFKTSVMHIGSCKNKIS